MGAYKAFVFLTASRALYPPIMRCNNPLCTSEVKILKATSTMGRKIVLYTLEDGACATYHFKLRCPSKFSRCIFVHLGR